MLTGEIRNKVDKIWTDMWAGGIANPLTVIEQLTYLMFIKTLDDKELENESFAAISGTSMPRIFDDEHQELRWSQFRTNQHPKDMYEMVSAQVFPFIKKLNGNAQSAFSRYMEDAMFLIPTPQLLQKIVTGLDDLYEHDIKSLDMKGDIYEYMLDKLAISGQNGQFRTPKHIREMMVALLDPQPNDMICDPACGTAGFLVSAAEYIRSRYEKVMNPEQWVHYTSTMFTGYDMDRTMLRLSAMNLMLHSIDNPHITYRDSVSKENMDKEAYSVILANPPFKGNIDAESIADNLKTVCDTKKTELLFVALFLRMLKKGGRCACIVPDGVLFGSSKAHKSLRKELVEKHNLQAVISMPSGVFKPYAGVSTAVLVFTKTGAGGTEKVWFYDMKSDGYSLDDKRTPLGHNGDIDDIIERFHQLDGEVDRKRTEQSFLVGKEDIIGNEYDLSINRYKEVEHEKINYDSPEAILGRLDSLNQNIIDGFVELRNIINSQIDKN